MIKVPTDSEEKKTCYVASYIGTDGNGRVSDFLNIFSWICQRMTACEGKMLTWKHGNQDIEIFEFNQLIFY